MQAPNWTDFLQCSVCTNRYNTTTLLPISLSCGHTICKKCLAEFMARVCPYDKTAISPNAEHLPPNSALLWLLGGEEDDNEMKYFSQLQLSPEDLDYFKSARSSIKSTAVFLQPLSEQAGSSVINYLTRPMLKKLVTVVNCQFLEADGRARVLRAARSITDRTITELLVMHQNQQQISTLLWSAIRSRGCQFLGPVMQEEALKLILKVLEGGAFLSRKNIVLYVVQQLQQQDFHQASKTCVGHVVQLLYRASCFNVEKRDEDSSRMRLKEEFRTYEALRREHDAQIIRVAMEGGLRISPEQWSALLYGDQKHKSDMQSIIDKLLSMGIATSGLNELIVAIRRSQDQHNLLEKIVPHLERLLQVDINIDKGSPLVQQWKFFSESMAALVAMLHEYSSFMRIQSGRYKTGLCPNLSKPGGCPKGDKCTYAHTEEEREKYRHLARKTKTKELGKPVSGPQSVPARAGSGGRWSGDVGTKLDTSPYSSLGASCEGLGSSYPSMGHSSGSSGYGVTEVYSSDYSSLPTVGNPPSLVLQQPQLVAYRSPHHSGPITVSGEQLAVYDPTPPGTAYFTAPVRRSNSIPEDYGIYGSPVVGVATDGRRYSSQHDTYLAMPPPSALDSIKQVHADIKKHIQPSYDEGPSQYPSTDMSHLHYPPNERGQYDNPPPGGVPRQLVTPHAFRSEVTHGPTSEEQHYNHDNSTSHAPTMAGSQPVPDGSSSTLYQPNTVATPLPPTSGAGEEEEEGEGEAQDEGLSTQMRQLQLKDPSYHETPTVYTTTGEGVAHTVAPSYIPPASHPQYPISHSNKYPMATMQDQQMGTVPQQQPLQASVSGDQERGEVAVMKERIQQLEAQLAREKMRGQVPGPQTVQQSPAHARMVYGNTDSQGYHVPVQQYATRVQPVQMYPTVSVQQPAAYYPQTPPTPSYQYSNWSGPHYPGELGPSLQSSSAGYVLQPQQPPVGRGVYIQQQSVAPAQNMLDTDHMLAMFLQNLEQSRSQPASFPQSSLPSPYPQAPHHSAHTGYGGGASLSYQYVPSSNTPYVMKPY